MQRYESYKPSGVEWLGDIPAHWEVQPIRTLFNERKERNESSKTDFILSVMKDIGVIPYDEKGNVGNKKSENIENYKVVYPGDLVINKMNAIIGSLGISRYHGALSQVYFVLYPKDHSRTNYKYLGYLFKVKPFQQSLIKISKGMMELRESIEFNEFKKLLLPVPPRDEQDRIVAFLDQKTAEIDAAIAKKERLIELLGEQKSICIEKVITEGFLAPQGFENTFMPKHWSRIKLKYCISLLPGFAFKSTFYSRNNDDIPLLRGVNINPGKLNWEDKVSWSKTALSPYLRYMLEPGDLVIGMDRPWVSDGIRVASISTSDTPCLLLQRVARLRASKGITQDFLELVVTSRGFLSYFRPMLTGISVPHISTEQIGNYEALLPSIEEQQTICKFVRQLSQSCEQVISKETQAMYSLRQLKNSVIADIVLGKLKV